MFELKSETTPALARKFHLYSAAYVDDGLGAQVRLNAYDTPENVTDLGRVTFSITQAYVNSSWLSTKAVFDDDLSYWIAYDDAPLPRAVVSKCIDFALGQIPVHFPNIALPDGYPVEHY